MYRGQPQRGFPDAWGNGSDAGFGQYGCFHHLHRLQQPGQPQASPPPLYGCWCHQLQPEPDAGVRGSPERSEPPVSKLPLCGSWYHRCLRAQPD